MPIYGKAGTGLSGDTSWAKSARAASVGASGEAKTEGLLNAMVGDYPDISVFHDLRVPGSRGNIDHAAVAGRRVVLIDTKVWKPGFLWTLGGTTRRGFEKFAACDSDFLGTTAVERLSKLLGVDIEQPIVAVWPSRKQGKVSTWAASMPGCRLMTPEQMVAHVRKMHRRGPADPEIVDKLRSLLVR